MLVATMLLGMMPAVVGARAANPQAHANRGQPAAPAVANRLLREAGIDNRHGEGSDGGNLISDVARYMGRGADFAGVAKEDVDEYLKAVALFLQALGAEVGEHLFAAVLLSVEYSGAGCTFGSDAQDTLTLTFSNDVHFDGTQSIDFADAASIGTNVPDWSISGNVLTITASSEFSNPRPRIGDYVTGLAGVVDSIGNPVVVPSEGVRVDGDECEKVVLVSALYSGLDDTFGTAAADTLTLIFSDDVYFEGDRRVDFAVASSIGTSVPTWSISGNVLTITAAAEFLNPRPEVGDFVVGLAGVVSECGCPVVVAEGGVEVVQVSLSWAGVWDTVWDYDGGPGLNRTLVLDQDSAGQVTGTYDYEFSSSTLSGTLSGSVDGYVLTGFETEFGESYAIIFTMSPDGNSFTGVWFEGDTEAGYWNGTRQTD